VSLRRVLALVRKEMREIVRDRMVFLLAFVLPIVLMLVFGYGMARDVENVSLAAVDEDHSELSRDYVSHYVASRHFDFKGYAGSVRDAERLLAEGSVRVVLVLPPRFQEELVAGRTAEVQTLIDGTFVTSARSIEGYTEAIHQEVAGGIQARFLARSLGIPEDRAAAMLAPVRTEVRYLYNRDMEAIRSVAPSLIMFCLMLVTPLLMALSVVREKETGSIFNIYASTVRRAEFLLGKLLPNVLVSFGNGLVLWAIATWHFGAPFKGSLPFFLLGLLLFVVCASGLGLLVSLLVRTQQAALMIAVIVSVIIAFQYGGMLVPVATQAGSKYVLSHLLPAMYFETILEGTFLKGAGGKDLWREALVLALYGAGLLGTSLAIFRKRTAT
jgi:ABC-2 type transport system permease protein